MYSELVCRSNYSFLTGASHVEELVTRAHALGLSSLALTDDDGLYGCVKAHLKSKELGIKFILSSALTLTGLSPTHSKGIATVYVENAAGYANLSELISKSRLAHPKGQAGIDYRELLAHNQGLICVIPNTHSKDNVITINNNWRELSETFPGRLYVGVTRHLAHDDAAKVAHAQQFARELEVPLVAHNDVHCHVRERQPLQDVMTAIAKKTTVAKAGIQLFPNAERHLKSSNEMVQLFHDMPEVVGRTLEISDSCNFTFDEIKYVCAEELLPKGLTAMGYLKQLCREGLTFRYPNGTPLEVVKQLEKEFLLVEALDYAGYFLTMWDIVKFAREKKILCQGRGSAANSIICFVLQITAIDPVRMGLLFERFLSLERREPPDIDVDFEHYRREEVLQYVYEKYGRHRAAMVCEHICFRSKLALREVGKALGLSLDQVDRLSSSLDIESDVGAYQLHQAGLSANDLAVQQTVALAKQLSGMPRHLSIHVGGFVITQASLMHVMPIENASMAKRTVVQFEKDDLSALNVLKVDLLALGMLTVVARSLELIEETTGQQFTMATIPAEDMGVYDMLCEGDSIGTFQIESRAQMNMLPRLKPRCFYDLVIEIAIIRPGPIVGQMVHPFLRRRNKEEEVTYPSPEVESILSRTLGVPLFQEQAMKLAMVAAGFSPGEADKLRRALTHKRANDLLKPFRERFIQGCISRGYEEEFAIRCFDSFKGFSSYGFPESHSASFALIAYASSWIKKYFPSQFCAALLDAQPMGFYAPHTLIEDAKRHGVKVRPIDVNASDFKSRMECNEVIPFVKKVKLDGPLEHTVLRLGFQMVKGFQEVHAQRLVSARKNIPYTNVADVARRARIPRHELARLALAGAFDSLCSNRRNALWELQALQSFDEDDLFYGMPMASDVQSFRPETKHERVATEFEMNSVSLTAHPVELLREELKKQRAVTAEQLHQMPNGKSVTLGGLVICRQRPPTAKGFTFLSVEDETGIANVVVTPQKFDSCRQAISGATLVLARGHVEKQGKVVNLKVESLVPLFL
jgi:error-prone DNA polymerase